MHHFEPARGSVGRHITIDAQDQQHQGARRAVQIQAANLPNLARVKPNGAKGIEAVVSVIMNPVVTPEGFAQELIEFDPPLQITVQYTDADTQATTRDAKGKPKLSLVLVYQDGAVWKWERLKTRVTPSASGGGTLQAQVSTLHPQDPIVMCRP